VYHRAVKAVIKLHTSVFLVSSASTIETINRAERIATCGHGSGNG